MNATRRNKMRFDSVMKMIQLASLALITSGAVYAETPIKAEDMGLSKTSVFDVPTPRVSHYNVLPPGQSKLLPRAYQGAPPQVPHDIADYLPITTVSNMCIACHAQPDQWGKTREQGMATPIPPSHYTDQRNAPGKVTEQLIGARFNCNQCHVPQSDAPQLVENTFNKKKSR